MSFSRWIALLPLLTLLQGCGGKTAESKPEPAPPVAVATAKASRETIPLEYVATGSVRARVTSTLSARVTGQIREVRAQAGDPVRAGQTLVVLDAREIETAFLQAEAARTEARGGLPELENAIAAAKAQLDLAEKTFARMKDLFEKKSISTQEFDEASARRQVAQANFEMTSAKRAQLDAKIQQTEQAIAGIGLQRGYARINAPFDGVVTERRAEPGAMAAPGMPLLTVEQAGALRFEATLEEGRLGIARRGQEISVRLDALDHDIKGRVAEIAPAIDPVSRSFFVKIDLPRVAGARSGLFGRARFPLGSRDALLIPASAVRENGQVLSVYVATQGVARSRLVTAGTRRDGRVEILSGLTSGESVVAPVPPGLADGSRLEVRP